MKTPKIKWIPFDSNNPPANLNPETIGLRDRG